MKMQKISLLSVISLFCLITVTLFTSSINSLAQNRSAYSVQIVSSSNEADALATIADLKSKGVESYLIKSEVPGKGTRYRVRVGKFASLQNAKAAGDQLIAKGVITEFAVMAYETPTSAVAVRREPKKTQAATNPTPEKQLTEKQQSETAETVAAPAEQKSSVESKEAAKETEQAATTGTAGTAKTEPPASAEPPVVTKEAPKTEIKPELKTESPETKSETKSELRTEPKTEPPASTENPVVTKEAPKTEIKPELRTKPKTEVSPEAKPTETKTDTVKAPAAAEASVSAEKEKEEPKIAMSPVADALAEFALAKSNWRLARRAAETDKNLRAIHFVDSMTGWAAGDAGAIYRTTDGGRTWKPLLSGVSANINYVYFLDWNHGWMIGDSTSKDDEGETVLLSTINGGRTWMIQKLSNLLSVHFTDLQNGWAVGRNSTLLHTTNGGVDWKPAEQIQAVVGLPVESSSYNFGFRDVYFLDPDHGWLIGNFYGRAQNNIGGLFVTSDGGKTWKRVPLTLETKYVSGRFTPGTINSVRFTDENTGSVTGEMKDGENRFFFALHTRDGGKTWEQHRTSVRSNLSTQFLDPVNGWMAAFAPREGSAEAVVYDSTLMRTDNGGQSWQTDFTAKGSRIRSLFFLSPQKGWAVGDRGMILRYEEKTKAMN